MKLAVSKTVPYVIQGIVGENKRRFVALTFIKVASNEGLLQLWEVECAQLSGRLYSHGKNVTVALTLQRSVEDVPGSNLRSATEYCGSSSR
jgi:hypothetical protein